MFARLFLAGLLASISFVPAAAAGASDSGNSTETAKGNFSTADTDIGTLLDNPATRAILDKHVPELAENPQIGMARAMTLRQIQGFASDMLTDEILASIDADLAKLSGGT